MNPIRSRQMFLLLVAFAVGTAGLLVPQSSDAAERLFRVERKFFGAPFPAVPNGPESPYGDPGGAGRYIVYIEPYTTLSAGVAQVQSNNPVGSPFTLPAKFIDFQGTYTNYAKTAFPGYTSVSYLDYFNGLAKFGPDNGATGPTRVVFPTLGGNTASPNLGKGNPVTPTTTFSGRYDFSRAGSLNVTPGPNRFGGTMRFLYGPAAAFYQYIYIDDPSIFKAYGSFYCQVGGGAPCTISSAGTTIGEITSSGMVTRYLLNVKGTGTTTLSPNQSANKAKATTSLGNGSVQTPQGNASFLLAKNYYLHLNHPWTTGDASASNPLETPNIINPQYAGYDISLEGSKLTVTRIGTSAMFNKTIEEVTYTQTTYKQYLTGVRRVVSMVRPRLLHVYENQVDNDKPIITPFQAARVWTMKVFFVPEPAGIAMIATGFAFLVGIYSIRRR